MIGEQLSKTRERVGTGVEFVTGIVLNIGAVAVFAGENPVAEIVIGAGMQLSGAVMIVDAFARKGKI